jgi:hypothetical protein
LPLSFDNGLPAGHTACCVSAVVDDMWDLSAIYASYTNESGAPTFDPLMMLKLVVVAYATGDVAKDPTETSFYHCRLTGSLCCSAVQSLVSPYWNSINSRNVRRASG